MWKPDKEARALLTPHSWEAWLAMALMLLVLPGSAQAASICFADDVCSPTASTCTIKASYSVPNGCELNFGDRPLTIESGGVLTIGSGTLSIVAGDLTMRSGSTINGRPSSGPGGSVYIVVARNIYLDTKIDVAGPAGGGLIDISSVYGSVTFTTGTYYAYGTAAAAYGGTISVVAPGDITVKSGVSYFDAYSGASSAGGYIYMSAGSRLTIEQSMSVGGGTGSGGYMDLSSGSDLTVASGATLKADGSSSYGNGGYLTLAAGGNLISAGVLTNLGSATSSKGGYGGVIDLSAILEVRLTGTIRTTGYAPDGWGGDVYVKSGMDLSQAAAVNMSGSTNGPGGGLYLESTGASVKLDGTVTAISGTNAYGGIVNMLTPQHASISKALDLDGGASGGGTLYVKAKGDIGITAVTISLLGGGNGGNGGDMTLNAGGSLSTSATINSNGHTGGGVPGYGGNISFTSGGTANVGGYIKAGGNGTGAIDGDISVTACEINIVTGAQLLTNAITNGGGTNRMYSREQLNVYGKLAASGQNLFYYRSSVPRAYSGSSITPAATSVLDTNLHPCCADADQDYICDVYDNCTFAENRDQSDVDGDGRGDSCDNCGKVYNADQANADGDAYGAACDCNDSVWGVNPSAAEVCDGIDNDCDGKVDVTASGGQPTNAPTWYLDQDADTYGATGQSQVNCNQPNGYVSRASDCDDSVAEINPGATETCDEIDNNCDGQVDEGVQTIYHEDMDNDQYGNPAVAQPACAAPGGFVKDGTDCKDDDGSIYPGAPELCDGIDQSCDGVADEGVTPTWYADGDGDQFGDPARSSVVCQAPEGYVAAGADCNDANAAIFPGAPESCNDGIDQDCSGQDLDCNDMDNDGDGVTESGGDCDDDDPSRFPLAEEVPYDDIDQDCNGTDLRDVDGDGYEGTGAGGSDCNDGDSAIHPAATEICDTVDNNCDGQIDDVDLDQDGHVTVACGGPDCDDQQAAIKPGAAEVQDGVDNDCDGLKDEGTPVFDDDGDGITDADGDCSDADSSVYPGAVELPDSKDNDCDNVIDETTSAYDDDGDGKTEAAGDCDDTDASTYPGAAELEDGKDNDCDTQVDNGTPVFDDDGDGKSESDGDCDDADASSYPGAQEIEDGKDNDCDTVIDDGTAAYDDDADGLSETAGDCDDTDANIHPGADEVKDDRDNDCDGKIDEGTGPGDDDDTTAPGDDDDTTAPGDDDDTTAPGDDDDTTAPGDDDTTAPGDDDTTAPGDDDDATVAGDDDTPGDDDGTDQSGGCACGQPGSDRGASSGTVLMLGLALGAQLIRRRSARGRAR